MTRNRSNTTPGWKKKAVMPSARKSLGRDTLDGNCGKNDTVFKNSHGFRDGMEGHGKLLERGYPLRDTFQRRGFKKKKQLHQKPDGHVEPRSAEIYA